MNILTNIKLKIYQSDFVSRVYYITPMIVRKIVWKIYFAVLDFGFKCDLFKNRHLNILIEKVYTIYINPNDIKYASLSINPNRAKIFENVVIIEGGDWDLKKIKVEEIDSFVAMKEHFTEGVPLSKTKFYARVIKEIEEGKVKWRCRTKDEFDIRCKEIYELYDNIRDKGYKTQRELGQPHTLDEITVYVDRNGEFLFEDGRHRLAIAKILGIQKIPVIVTKRHYQWAKFRNELFLFSKEILGTAYQPLLHPDLKVVASSRGDERWELISKNLPFLEGSVLDIGSNLGYFCHKFEELGFNCYAVENSYPTVYFLKKLAEIRNKKIEIIPKSIFEIETKKYDIVLALSIFHHFLKSKNTYNKLTKFLGELDIKIMFFEPHKFNEPQMKNAYINYNEPDFINYVLENSCLNKYKLLGKLQNGRSLYLLSCI